MLNFRQFDYESDSDYENVVACHLAAWPDSGNRIQEWKYHDRVRPKKYYWNRLAIEKDGQIIGSCGYNEVWWNTEVDQYHMGGTVHPDHQQQGIGTAAYHHVLGILQRERKVASVVIDSREDKPGALKIVEREGYRLISRGPRSELQVETFDRPRFAPLLEKLQREGIRFTTVRELMTADPDWQHKLYELDWVFSQDEPSPDTPTKTPFEEYVKDTLESPSFSPHCWFVAVDGEQYAGFSQLWPNHNNLDLLNTGWTGVDRPYRRRGLAKALKLHAIDYARQNGIKRITTENEETNPMYDINMQLGFKPQPAWMTFRKDFA